MVTCIEQRGENGGRPQRGLSRGKLKPTWTSKDTINDILSHYEGDYSYHQIANVIGVSYATVAKYFKLNYEPEALKQRQRRTRSVCQKELGLMAGKRFETHHNWKGRSLEPDGYYSVVKPEWYNTTQRRIPEHVAVYCNAHGLDKLPSGYVVHHKNECKSDNDIDNLQMMTRSEHSRHHRRLVNP